METHCNTPNRRRVWDHLPEFVVPDKLLPRAHHPFPRLLLIFFLWTVLIALLSLLPASHMCSQIIYKHTCTNYAVGRGWRRDFSWVQLPNSIFLIFWNKTLDLLTLQPLPCIPCCIWRSALASHYTPPASASTVASAADHPEDQKDGGGHVKTRGHTFIGSISHGPTLSKHRSIFEFNRPDQKI